MSTGSPSTPPHSYLPAHLSPHVSSPSLLPSFWVTHPPGSQTSVSSIYLTQAPAFCPYTCSSIYPSIHPSIHPPIYPPIHPLTHSPIRPSMHPSIYSPIRISIHPPTHQSTDAKTFSSCLSCLSPRSLSSSSQTLLAVCSDLHLSGLDGRRWEERGLLRLDLDEARGTYPGTLLPSQRILATGPLLPTGSPGLTGLHATPLTPACVWLCWVLVVSRGLSGCTAGASLVVCGLSCPMHVVLVP